MSVVEEFIVRVGCVKGPKIQVDGMGPVSALWERLRD